MITESKWKSAFKNLAVWNNTKLSFLLFAKKASAPHLHLSPPFNYNLTSPSPQCTTEHQNPVIISVNCHYTWRSPQTRLELPNMCERYCEMNQSLIQAWLTRWGTLAYSFQLHWNRVSLVMDNWRKSIKHVVCFGHSRLNSDQCFCGKTDTYNMCWHFRFSKCKIKAKAGSQAVKMREYDLCHWNLVWFNLFPKNFEMGEKILIIFNQLFVIACNHIKP